jgi:hypothetical protein
MHNYPSDYPSPSKEVFLPAGEEEEENASEAHQDFTSCRFISDIVYLN